jgi:hypothetical protein
VAISNDDTEQLNQLNLRLQTLLSESKSLRLRWAAAARDAQAWPDMSLDPQLFLSLHRARRFLRYDRDH